MPKPTAERILQTYDQPFGPDTTLVDATTARAEGNSFIYLLLCAIEEQVRSDSAMTGEAFGRVSLENKDFLEKAFSDPAFKWELSNGQMCYNGGDADYAEMLRLIKAINQELHRNRYGFSYVDGKEAEKNFGIIAMDDDPQGLWQRILRITYDPGRYAHNLLPAYFKAPHYLQLALNTPFDYKYQNNRFGKESAGENEFGHPKSYAYLILSILVDQVKDDAARMGTYFGRLPVYGHYALLDLLDSWTCFGDEDRAYKPEQEILDLLKRLREHLLQDSEQFERYIENVDHRFGTVDLGSKLWKEMLCIYKQPDMYQFRPDKKRPKKNEACSPDRSPLERMRDDLLAVFNSKGGSDDLASHVIADIGPSLVLDAAISGGRVKIPLTSEWERIVTRCSASTTLEASIIREIDEALRATKSVDPQTNIPYGVLQSNMNPGSAWRKMELILECLAR